MIKMDYDGAVHGPNHASAAIIDYNHVHQWQNGPTSEEIVNNRILKSEQRKRESVFLNHDSTITLNAWKRGSAQLHQF